MQSTAKAQGLRASAAAVSEQLWPFLVQQLRRRKRTNGDPGSRDACLDRSPHGDWSPNRIALGPRVVVVPTYDIAPDATLPEHKHPFARCAYVPAGTLRITNTETGQSNVYRTATSSSKR